MPDRIDVDFALLPARTLGGRRPSLRPQAARLDSRHPAGRRRKPAAPLGRFRQCVAPVAACRVTEYVSRGRNEGIVLNAEGWPLA